MIKLTTGNYYGELLRKANLDGLYLSETLYRKNSALPSHEHENIFFCFVLSGSYSEHYDKLQRECKQGSLIFHPRYEKHSDWFGQSDTKCFNVELNENWLKGLSYKKELLKTPIHLDSANYSRSFWGIYKNFIEFDDVSELAISGNLLNVIAELIRFENPNYRNVPQWLVRVKEKINDCYSENLSMFELSKIADVHPVHLSRSFKVFYKYSVGEYQRKIKVKSSISFLHNKSFTLAEIALLCGFTDQSHFSHIFKKHTGFTPGEYRKTLS